MKKWFYLLGAAAVKRLRTAAVSIHSLGSNSFRYQKLPVEFSRNFAVENVTPPTRALWPTRVEIRLRTGIR